MVVLDVLEGLVHETAVAALVALGPGTVHQVLLAQGHHLAGLPVVLALQSAGGAESPAGAALTLRETHTKKEAVSGDLSGDWCAFFTTLHVVSPEFACLQWLGCSGVGLQGVTEQRASEVVVEGRRGAVHLVGGVWNS